MTGNIVLLRKRSGVSSFSALFPLKRALGTRKVGHTGTLDPFAEGLLVALTGYATKLAPFFSALDKEYSAGIRFGLSTDTLDPEGTIDGNGDVPEFDRLRASLEAVTGPHMQTPPAFSAIKIGGKRAYREARKGVVVEIPPRSIVIHELSLLRYDPPVAGIDVRCSKGTYIRSLARDVAAQCGTVAYVETLTRTAVGPFRLSEIPEEEPWTTLKPLDALTRLGKPSIVTASPQTHERIRYGRPISREHLIPPPAADGTFAVADDSGELLCIVEVSGESVRYRFVVPMGTDAIN